MANRELGDCECIGGRDAVLRRAGLGMLFVLGGAISRRSRDCFACAARGARKLGAGAGEPTTTGLALANYIACRRHQEFLSQEPFAKSQWRAEYSALNGDF